MSGEGDNQSTIRDTGNTESQTLYTSQHIIVVMPTLTQ